MNGMKKDKSTQMLRVDKGIIIKYLDYQYKKKVLLTYNLHWKRMNELTDVDKIVNDLNKFIEDYFRKKYKKDL